jgi:hypothetical protein
MTGTVLLWALIHPTSDFWNAFAVYGTRMAMAGPTTKEGAVVGIKFDSVAMTHSYAEGSTAHAEDLGQKLMGPPRQAFFTSPMLQEFDPFIAGEWCHEAPLLRRELEFMVLRPIGPNGARVLVRPMEWPA